MALNRRKKDVDDATILSEEKASDKVDNKPDDLDFDKLEKEKIEGKSKEVKSETIDLKQKQTETSEKVKVDFMSDNSYDDILKMKSKKAESNETNTESQFGNKSQEELREEIKQAEIDSKNNFSAKDMEDIAKVIVMMFDTGISTGLRMWSKDTSDTAYSITADKRKMLEYQLSLILVKYQSKFSIEFMFLVSLVICYMVPFTKARERRRELKQIEKDLEEGNITEEELENQGKLKRGKGKPGK
jgi:hypothetical protein